MKIKLKDTPHLIKLPAKVQLLLFLIREDLKANKMRLHQCEVGGGDNPYQLDITTMLLSVAGFKEITDSLMTFYCQLMDKHARKLNGDHDQLMKRTLKVYVELMGEKGRGRD